MTDFGTEDWFALDWSDWTPLNPENDRLSEIPTSARLYRVRHRNKDELECIGETIFVL